MKYYDRSHVDAGQHGEAPGADESEAERDEDPDPESDGDHVATLPLGTEPAAADLEQIHQMDENLLRKCITSKTCILQLGNSRETPMELETF